MLAQVKAKQKDLQKRHSCSPRPTLLLPIAVYLPVFLAATISIREACARAAQFKSHIVNSAVAARSHTVDSGSLPGLEGMEGADRINAAKHLLTLANEKLTDSLSLVELDPNLFLPIAVGVALSLNVELSASLRAAFLAARQAEKTAAEASSVGPPKSIKATAAANIASQKSGRRRYATDSAVATTALSKSSSIVTNVLRVMSVGMIIIATQNPVVRLLKGPPFSH
jgi:inner membrane protein COX18